MAASKHTSSLGIGVGIGIGIAVLTILLVLGAWFIWQRGKKYGLPQRQERDERVEVLAEGLHGPPQERAEYEATEKEWKAARGEIHERPESDGRGGAAELEGRGRKAELPG